MISQYAGGLNLKAIHLHQKTPVYTLRVSRLLRIDDLEHATP